MSVRILALVGSLRAGSHNRQLAEAAVKLAPEGAEVNLFEGLAEIPFYNEDIDVEGGVPAAAAKLREAAQSADGFLLFSPEYNGTIPAVLKNAIDWLSRLPEQPFRHKPVLIQSASPGALGGARMQYHLRQSLVFLDARVFNVPEVMVATAHTKIDEEKGELTDAGTRDFIAKQLAAFAAFVEN